MRVYRLGIIGGCLSHQAGTPISQLYHRVLSGLLDEACDVTLRPVIESSFSLPLDERLAAVALRQPDLVLVHARNSPLIRSCRLYRRTVPPAEPVAPRRRDGGDSARPVREAGEAFSRPPHTTLISQFNIALGVLTGRHRRFADGMVREIMRAESVSAGEAMVAPIVVGFTMRYRGFGDRLACAAADRALRRACGRSGLAFVDLLPGFERRFCLTDGHHLTVDGHRFMAERLFAQIAPLVG